MSGRGAFWRTATPRPTRASSTLEPAAKRPGVFSIPAGVSKATSNRSPWLIRCTRRPTVSSSINTRWPRRFSNSAAIAPTKRSQAPALSTFKGPAAQGSGSSQAAVASDSTAPLSVTRLSRFSTSDLPRTVGFRYHWLVPGDLNGFFALAIDNLALLGGMSALLTGVFHLPSGLVFGRMVPGTALGVLVGDLAYTALAFRLARRGRRD